MFSLLHESFGPCSRADLDLVIILGEAALCSSVLAAIVSILGVPVSYDFVECYLQLLLEV